MQPPGNFRVWLFLALLVISLAIALYSYRISSAARKVVAAVDGPPLIQADIDFSEPFTNEFVFRHTVKPFYGTVYLSLRANPTPKHWDSSESAGEDLQKARGEMRVLNSQNSVIEKKEMRWLYLDSFRHRSEIAPFQPFFGRLPLGEYKLVIQTLDPVPQLKGVKQQLILRYDLIHERSIASFFGKITLITASASLVFGSLLIHSILRSRQ